MADTSKSKSQKFAVLLEVIGWEVKVKVFIKETITTIEELKGEIVGHLNDSGQIAAIKASDITRIDYFDHDLNDYLMISSIKEIFSCSLLRIFAPALKEYFAPKKIASSGQEPSPKKPKYACDILDALPSIAKEMGTTFKDHFEKGPCCWGSQNFVLKERESQINRFLVCNEKRWKHKQNPPGIELRVANPLLATQSGPGGGKTFFMTCLSQFSSEILYQHQHIDPKLKEMISSNTLAINISFNSTTIYNSTSRLDISVETGLRILHSYFARKMPFEDFLANLAKIADLEILTLTVALRITIAHWKEIHSQPLHVFLGVDELMRIDSDSKITRLLTEIGGNLDTQVAGSCDLFTCLVTSLDAEKLLTCSLTKSGRQVGLLPLFPLQNPQMLFAAFHHVDSDVLRALICDCGGHPRSLEALYEITLASCNNLSQLLHDYPLGVI